MIYDTYKVCLASLPACQGNWLPQSPPAIWGTSSILASNSEATQQAYTAHHHPLMTGRPAVEHGRLG